MEARDGLPAGTDPRRPLGATRLLVVGGSDPGPTFAEGSVGDLPELLEPGDLLVLNDAATLPASLHGEWAGPPQSGAPLELRLAGAEGPEDFPTQMWAVLFGAGDWRMDTDARPAPPPIPLGARLRFGALHSQVVAHSSLSKRLVRVAWDRSGDALAAALYAIGRPVQYRHLPRPLSLAEVQTPYALRPWAMEMPSTGRPLSWALLDRLARRGVGHAFLTHAAGLSATGDRALDRALPLPERYHLPLPTLRAVVRTRACGGRVIAVGTTVARALEAAARSPAGPGHGVAHVRLDPSHQRRWVDGILTGIHAPGESHFDLLGAFAPRATLDRAHRAALRGGYLAHELGDLMLLLPERAGAAGQRRAHNRALPPTRPGPRCQR